MTKTPTLTTALSAIPNAYPADLLEVHHVAGGSVFVLRAEWEGGAADLVSYSRAGRPKPRPTRVSQPLRYSREHLKGTPPIDTNPTHLIAAGFTDTAPGYFQRGPVVIQYATALTSAFSIFSVESDLRSNYSTDSIGEAIALARMVENIDELASAILSDAMVSVGFYMTGKRGALDLNAAPFTAEAMASLRHVAANMVATIANEAKRVGALPKDPPNLDEDGRASMASRLRDDARAFEREGSTAQAKECWAKADELDPPAGEA